MLRRCRLLVGGVALSSSAGHVQLGAGRRILRWAVARGGASVCCCAAVLIAFAASCSQQLLAVVVSSCSWRFRFSSNAIVVGISGSVSSCSIILWFVVMLAVAVSVALYDVVQWC